TAAEVRLWTAGTCHRFSCTVIGAKGAANSSPSRGQPDAKQKRRRAAAVQGAARRAHLPHLELRASLPGRFFLIRNCSAAALSPILRTDVERSQTIPVSFDRAEMAAGLGPGADLSRVESGRDTAARTPLRQTPRAGRKNRARRTAPAEILHPRYVSLPVRRGLARGASGRLYGH